MWRVLCGNDCLHICIVNCLLTAGYDSADVICSMDTTGPRNSIEVIEELIEKYFHGNKEYYSNQMLATKPFFPPGHKLRIVNFFSEIKGAMKSKRKQGNTSSQCRPSKFPHIAKGGTAKCLDEPGQELNIAHISGQIRGSISRWVRSESCDKLRSLKETF